MCNMFGGPSSQEEGGAAQESSLASTLNANYNTVFGEQQSTIANLNSTIQQIKSGNTGPGFGGAENAARISDIEATGAAQARNVAQAAQNRGAGQVFNGSTDSSGLARTRGTQQQLTEEATSAAQTQTSNALNAETAANYGQGRANAEAALSGFNALAGIENPNPIAGEATNANSSAFKENSQINQEKIAKSQAIAKLVGSIATTAATGGLGGLSALGGGESLFEGLKDFGGGALNALSGTNSFDISGPSGGGGGGWGTATA